MPALTRYEKLLERELEKNSEAMFKVNLGDSHRHALVKGIRQGLETAGVLYRQTMQSDADDDA